MASLRETKKAATKHLLAECAVRIALSDGIDRLTVAQAAEDADVSPRTFHNYFPSRDAALSWYLGENLKDLREKMIVLIKEDGSIINAIEKLITEALKTDANDPSSILSLYHLAMILETVDKGSPKKLWLAQLTESLSQVEPATQLSDYERYLIVQLAAMAGLLATSWEYERRKPHEVEARVHRTFDILRRGTLSVYNLD